MGNRKNRPRRFAVLAALAAVLSACTTVRTRITRHQAAFDSYPPAVQGKIRAGKVDVGFTREQVAIALGRPDRTYTRKTAAADQEVWVYGAGSGAARADLGVGIGPAGNGPFGDAAGTAIGADSELGGAERTRVVFQGDAAVSVDNRRQ